MLSTVYLAAEDEPSLAVGHKLIAEASPLTVYREENAHGYGNLSKKVGNFQQMGNHGLPVLMIADLDSRPCPPSMINAWLGIEPSPGFLFRICVREIEAWLLSHREAAAHFLHVRLEKIPSRPETLRDPKEKLIKIAQFSSQRKIRVGFMPIGSSTIGPDYNQLLGDFIRDSWSPEIASKLSPSLARARAQIRRLANSVEV